MRSASRCRLKHFGYLKDIAAYEYLLVHLEKNMRIQLAAMRLFGEKIAGKFECIYSILLYRAVFPKAGYALRFCRSFVRGEIPKAMRKQNIVKIVIFKICFGR